MPSSAPYAYGAAGAELPDGRVVAVGASGANSAVESLRFSGLPVDAGGGASPPWIRPIGNSYSFANAAAALADGRVLSAGVATDRTGNAALALVRTSPEGELDGSWDGDGLALVRARDATVAADVLLDPEGRRGRRRPRQRGRRALLRARALRRRRRAGRSFGSGLVLTSFPGATVARATALARQGDGKLVVAGIACASGSGPQCSGGTSRLALARYVITPGPRLRAGGGRGAARTDGQAAPRAVRLAAVEPARAARPRARTRALPPGQALPRQADAAPPAHGPALAAAGIAHGVDPRAPRPHGRGEGPSQAPRHAPPRARADGVRRPRRDRRAAASRQAGDAAARLSGVSAPSA